MPTYYYLNYVQKNLNQLLLFRWIQVRIDIITDSCVFIFILIAILLSHKGLISLGALALIISSGITVSLKK